MKRFLPLILLTIAGFTFNTSELTPIGLLSDIATDFGVTEAHAGLLITIYAWVVACLSLPLMLWCARMDFRRLLLYVVALFFVSHIGSVLSIGFWTLMLSRIGVATAHSLFWSIAPTMAVAVSPDGRRSTALSALVAGGGVALVIGLPLGRVLGLLAGWRVTLGSLGLLSFLILIGLYFFFPRFARSGQDESRGRMLKDILKSRPLLMVYFITAVIVTGHYTGYSYIEPFMDSILHIEAKAITFTLCLFGIAGLAGSFLMTRYFPRHPRFIISAACISLPVIMLFLLPGARLGLVVLSLICVLWGLAITVYNIAFQNEIIVLSPHNSAVAMSIYSGIFNLGIGAGAFTGGIVCERGMMADIGYVGGTIALAAALFALFRYLPDRSYKE
ncbi:MFS transporter [uncultured Duncaniella sp.]|uniref:MFS transporter n=1 Tax=uncultured Duncaniella sp. TaxID=2768039 RepID=UPI0025A9F974|nr:MFS transporter [uncultured Duncaniella sp.]